MAIGERILLMLSRDPGGSDYAGTDAHDEWNLDNALEFLTTAFPGFEQRIEGKRVLDFGCGLGWQSVALARRGAARVVGVEINPAWRKEARALAEQAGVADRVEFVERIGEGVRGQFDIAFSQSSFEHFGDPVAILNEMKSALRPGGSLFITFYGPWLSPYGAHMHFFTKVPWVNLWFSEKTVLKVRSRFRDDGATRYEEITGGLNKMTVAKFERIAAESGLEVRYRHYRCVRGVNFLARVPVVRELFINVVSCEFSVPARAASQTA